MLPTCACKHLAEKCKNSSEKCFCQFWLFENFSEEEYGILKSIGRQKQYSKSQAVFFQGEPADEVFLIKCGRIRLSKYLEDGSEVILDFRSSGDLFGENAFNSEETFPVQAIAMEDTITCGAKKSDIEDVILKYPKIGIAMMKNMSEKMSNMTYRLETLSIGNLEDRLYKILVSIAKNHGHRSGKGFDIAFPLTHEELGFLANAHRVSVTKAVSRLLESGRIVREGKMYSLSNKSMNEAQTNGACIDSPATIRKQT